MKPFLNNNYSVRSSSIYDDIIWLAPQNAARVIVRQPVHFESNRFDSARRIPVRQGATCSNRAESLKLEFLDAPSPSSSCRSSTVFPCPLESVKVENHNNVSSSKSSSKVVYANKTKNEKIRSFIINLCSQRIYIYIYIFTFQYNNNNIL